MTNHDKNQTETTKKADPVVETPVVAAENKESEPKKPKTKIPKNNKMGLAKLGKQVPVGPGNFWNNMLSTVLLLIVVIFVFSYITEGQAEAPTELTLSDVVTQIKAGEVSEIIVRGSSIEVSYNVEGWVPGEAKKEVDASVTDSLTSLGVTAEELVNVKIDVQRETGFAYWLGLFAPFLFPLLFLGIIIWFLMKSAKGGGMQALSFGNSKARMIDPDDGSKKITFKKKSKKLLKKNILLS